MVGRQDWPNRPVVGNMLCPGLRAKRRCYFDRCGNPRRRALPQRDTDLGRSTHPCLGRGNLRGDPCKQG
jgi:hypothetical protein